MELRLYLVFAALPSRAQAPVCLHNPHLGAKSAGVFIAWLSL